MLDELAHAGPEHLDPAFVEGYDQKQANPVPTDDLAVFAAHGLTQPATIVDLGAGQGSSRWRRQHGSGTSRLLTSRRSC